VSILVPQDYVQFDMDWDPVTFLPELRDKVLPEFKRLERLGATNIALSTLQSLVTASLDNPPFFHDIHFVFNSLAIVTSLALFALGIHRCCLLKKERRRRRRDQQIREAVRANLVTPALTVRYDEEAPRYQSASGPHSTRMSTLDVASNVTLYPAKPTAP
jgi:hypothetical protein